MSKLSFPGGGEPEIQLISRQISVVYYLEGETEIQLSRLGR